MAVCPCPPEELVLSLRHGELERLNRGLVLFSGGEDLRAKGKLPRAPKPGVIAHRDLDELRPRGNAHLEGQLPRMIGVLQEPLLGRDRFGNVGSGLEGLRGSPAAERLWMGRTHTPCVAFIGQQIQLENMMVDAADGLDISRS